MSEVKPEYKVANENHEIKMKYLCEIASRTYDFRFDPVSQGIYAVDENGFIVEDALLDSVYDAMKVFYRHSDNSREVIKFNAVREYKRSQAIKDT